MEAKETGSQSILDTILPPRLEDAGLEDCALPLDSIKEAFLKAASFAATDDDGEEDDADCVQDPWPKYAPHDAVLGGGERDEPGECVVVKGKDEVVVVGGDGGEKERPVLA